MKPARLSLHVSIVSLLTLAGCGDRAAPTQPFAIDLAGHWSGTVTSQQGSAGLEALCRSESIGADVTQGGASVSGRLLASCTGSLDLAGKIEGNVLTGTLTGGLQTFAGGRVTAVVSSSRIEMTVGRATKEEFFPMLSIELLR